MLACESRNSRSISRIDPVPPLQFLPSLAQERGRIFSVAVIGGPFRAPFDPQLGAQLLGLFGFVAAGKLGDERRQFLVNESLGECPGLWARIFSRQQAAMGARPGTCAAITPANRRSLSRTRGWRRISAALARWR
jgi:hypothetical protein